MITTVQYSLYPPASHVINGPPGIGKTQIMQQIAQECNIGLVAYTITHHTRQSAVGLPFIKEKTFDGKSYSVTEYTMSEIIYSIYQYIEESGKKKVFFLSTKSTVFLKHLLRQCCNFYNAKLSEIRLFQKLDYRCRRQPARIQPKRPRLDFVTLDRVRKLILKQTLTFSKLRQSKTFAPIHFKLFRTPPAELLPYRK